jgi:hypothetical protein
MAVCALVAAFGLALASEPGRAVSDGALRVPLPPGWAGSVARGMQGSHPVAWILAGDFALPARAAASEGTPRVPAGRVLVVIGDFFPAGSSRRWRKVAALSPPRGRSWRRVRFADRALVVTVRFGSRPTAKAVRSAERVLAGVTRAKR